MALPSIVHRFQIDLSDVDRGVYEAVDLRVARHPSETEHYMLTRVLAYLLELQEGLSMSRGLSVADEPALWRHDLTGALQQWIEVGSPSAERLHVACKAVEQVSVYTYKDPEKLQERVAATRVHRAEEISAWSLEVGFLDELGAVLTRNNTWSVVHTGGEIYVTAGARTVVGRRERVPLESGG